MPGVPGRRREESGRKSREGTTDVGETGLDSCDVKVCVYLLQPPSKRVGFRPTEYQNITQSNEQSQSALTSLKHSRYSRLLLQPIQTSCL
jgi:hypothetical protein